MTEKKYYWLKMQEDFFEQKEIKALRRVAGGDTFTIIYQKMLLKSLRTDGLLYYEGMGKDFSDEVALDIDEDLDNVAITIQFLKQKGLIFSGSKDEYEMSKVKLMVGSETPQAERMRRLREKSREKTNNENKSVTLLPVSDTEIDIDKEIDTDKDIMSGKPDESISPNIMIAKKALNYFNQQSNRKFNLLAKKNTKPIIARLNEGFSPEDLKKVIDLACLHWKDKAEYEQFLRPETIFNGRFDERLNNTIKWEYKQADVKQKEVAIDYDHLENNGDPITNDQALEALKRLKANSS
ncbi:phage replisome organizer N-terminal domain-containing protein [Oenococcus oeni]|uniref:phage replisome organizer N-terminal domain-containing protein n=2 Tax=Oenococcus oeni TaxID=1247 RepID=UPI000277B916|nr:phage replisome organizer N-terminal domain-containing protein [Oenococcus oeni]EJO02687.1 phage replisome organizer [Oenococcus oeni AWRIB418]OIM24126.1 replication protein [Oenococcus oeni]OIM39023.1 replication protein [Oenococcus oeni]QGR01759.1 replication protein [Oenococcus oeni]TEU23279.1 replication protein [Oenococcus oeni]